MVGEAQALVAEYPSYLQGLISFADSRSCTQSPELVCEAPSPVVHCRVFEFCCVSDATSYCRWIHAFLHAPSLMSGVVGVGCNCAGHLVVLLQDLSSSEVSDDSSSGQEDMAWSSWSRRPSRAGFGNATALCGGSEVDFARAAGGSVYSSSSCGY